MAKIPKNRQDSEMASNFKEQISFENITDDDEQPAAKPAKAKPAQSAYATFITPELEEDLGKALLTLKLNLYKEGIVDYSLKVSCEANQVVLKAAPLKKQAKQRP